MLKCRLCCWPFPSPGGDPSGTTGAEIWQTANGTDWSQVNVDGFGDSNNWHVGSGAVFNDCLYIGTWNWANGGEVWQLAGGGRVYLPIILKNFSP